MLAVISEAIMPLCLESKACDACAIAKRRCEKQLPHCRRCRSRGIECTYPPTKPGSFNLLEGENTFAVERDISIFTPLSFSDLSDLEKETDAGLPVLDLALANSIVGAQSVPTWFTSSEAWSVSPYPTVTAAELPISDIKHHIRNILQWLKQWVATGSNPFIHKRLYQTRFPQSIQDAYMALSCYFSKTDLNEQTVFRIIEDRVRRLVDGGLTGSSLENFLDTHEQLARVQALAMYQTICLYDGDIRLRHLAEGYIPVLKSWIQEMVVYASQIPCLGRMVVSSPYENAAIEPSGENLLWYSWILAEGIRRTSMIAASIQSIYMIQRDGTVTCQGSMMFTTRQGAWDADSAYAWHKMCSEVNVGFLQLTETPKLFAKAAPDDVDEFAKMMLSITCGVSRVNMWIDR